ncbi:MAG: Hpt domain-containing protein [Spirochaetota bacterium]
MKPDGMKSMATEQSALRHQFFRDLEDLLDRAEGSLLSLETNPGDGEPWRSLCRDFHTAKGNAGLVGEYSLQRAFHAIENDLGNDGPRELSPDTIQQLYEYLDLFRSVAAAGETGSYERALRGVSSRSRSAGERRAIPAAVVSETVVPQDVDCRAFGRIVGRLANVVETHRRFEDAVLARPDVESAPLLQDLGLAVVDLGNAVPETLRELRRLTRYLELALEVLIMGHVQYDPMRFSLLREIVDDIRNSCRLLLTDHGISVTVLVDDPADLSRLAREPHTLPSGKLIIVNVELPSDELIANHERILQMVEIGRAADREVVFRVRSTAIATTIGHVSRSMGVQLSIASDCWNAVVTRYR